ncbi:MAG: exodeoxyribonuclease III [Desulfosalsimonadaceae bacterium]
MQQQNKGMLRLVSWNVNGLRAALKKNFMQVFSALDADVFCVQETKLQEHQLDTAVRQIPGYLSYWSHCTVKKGYSGVGAWSGIEPEAVNYGIGIPDYDAEGRILELDLGSFVLFNIYFPNGQMSEERLSYKLEFYRDFFAYAARIRDSGRSLVITGDYNTAHNEIDLKNPKANAKTSGFLRVERDWLDAIEAAGYVDTFRFFYPDRVQYSWWSYRSRARERNAGWRIDYFFVTKDMIADGRIHEAFIADDIHGSDHCPVGLIVREQQT